jgi:hypothetical protein
MIKMKNRTISKLTTILLMAFVVFAVSCSKDKTPEPTPSQILSSTRWKTTMVKNAAGQDVTAANMAYVGYATYNSNGTFTITDLTGAPKSSGTWAITADGKKRILVTSTFTRIVDIITLTSSSFVYEVMNADSTKVQVYHEPVQ